jgi:hypothetical protein
MKTKPWVKNPAAAASRERACSEDTTSPDGTVAMGGIVARAHRGRVPTSVSDLWCGRSAGRRVYLSGALSGSSLGSSVPAGPAG